MYVLFTSSNAGGSVGSSESQNVLPRAISHNTALEKSTECVQFVQKLWPGQRFEIVKCNVAMCGEAHFFFAQLERNAQNYTECNIVL